MKNRERHRKGAVQKASDNCLLDAPFWPSTYIISLLKCPLVPVWIGYFILPLPDVINIPVHQMPDHLGVDYFLNRTKPLRMSGEEGIRAVVDPEILNDSFFLHVGIIFIPINLRILKIICCSAISAEGTRTLFEFLLKLGQIRNVQYESFNIQPLILI